MDKKTGEVLVSYTVRSSSSPPKPSATLDDCIARIRDELIPLAKGRDRDREQYWITYIRDYCSSDDIELNHIEADRALRLCLRNLGYGELVNEYDKVRKRYL
jgi:hypothetical protein